MNDNGERDTKLVFALNKGLVGELHALMHVCGLNDVQDFFVLALIAFDWTVTKRQEGRNIAAVSEKLHSFNIFRMDAIERSAIAETEKKRSTFRIVQNETGVRTTKEFAERIEFNLSEQEIKKMEALKDDCAITTDEEFINTIFTLTQWMIEEKMADKEIAAVRPTDYHMDFFSNAALDAAVSHLKAVRQKRADFHVVEDDAIKPGH